MLFFQASSNSQKINMLNANVCKFSSFVYLHMDLESIADTDLCYGNVDIDEIDVGIHKCIVFVASKPFECTLFMMNKVVGSTKGLIVLNSDYKGLEHCYTTYNRLVK